jgi:hypothetical protein
MYHISSRSCAIVAAEPRMSGAALLLPRLVEPKAFFVPHLNLGHSRAALRAGPLRESVAGSAGRRALSRPSSESKAGLGRLPPALPSRCLLVEVGYVLAQGRRVIQEPLRHEGVVGALVTSAPIASPIPDSNRPRLFRPSCVPTLGDHPLQKGCRLRREEPRRQDAGPGLFAGSA